MFQDYSTHGTGFPEKFKTQFHDFSLHLDKHVCRQCMYFEIIKILKPPVARKLAVRHTSFVCLTASFLATGGFTKFNDFSMIIRFFKFHDFSIHGTFFGDCPGFP